MPVLPQLLRPHLADLHLRRQRRWRRRRARSGPGELAWRSSAAGAAGEPARQRSRASARGRTSSSSCGRRSASRAASSAGPRERVLTSLSSGAPAPPPAPAPSFSPAGGRQAAGASVEARAQLHRPPAWRLGADARGRRGGGTDSGPRRPQPSGGPAALPPTLLEARPDGRALLARLAPALLALGQVGARARAVGRQVAKAGQQLAALRNREVGVRAGGQAPRQAQQAHHVLHAGRARGGAAAAAEDPVGGAGELLLPQQLLLRRRRRLAAVVRRHAGGAEPVAVGDVLRREGWRRRAGRLTDCCARHQPGALLRSRRAGKGRRPGKGRRVAAGAPAAAGPRSSSGTRRRRRRTAACAACPRPASTPAAGRRGGGGGGSQGWAGGMRDVGWQHLVSALRRLGPWGADRHRTGSWLACRVRRAGMGWAREWVGGAPCSPAVG